MGCHGGLCCLGRLAVAGFHQGTDFSCLGLLLLQQGVHLALGGAALLVALQNLGNNLFGVKILDSQPFYNKIGVFPEKFECKHYLMV